MLYYLLKGLLRPALRVFYAHATDAGPESLPEAGPLIVVANHPNTLMAPLPVGMLWRRQLHFLTNSRFFTSVGGWVLRASGAIPLYRQEDHAAAPAGERPAGGLRNPQRAANNDASFRASFELLSAGGALLIFPEGSSVLTRRLRPVKSGAARIALGAEARHDWQLGVRIVPVGLNYAAADRFRSRVYRRVGPPIRVADYRARYEANPSAAIRALTADLRRALDQQLHAPRTDADEALLRALEALLPGLLSLLPLVPLVPLPPRTDRPAARASSSTAGPEFALVGALLGTLHWLDGRDPARGQALRQRLLDQQHARHRAGLAPGAPLNLPPPHGGARARLVAVLGGPVWAWGVPHHAMAYRLPAYLAQRLTREAEFIASLTMVLGMLLLPLFYGAQT
ncbi:MAG: 1-acyl-sn-glycerol-3-phosphate acyltransferase, partial [Hymenobacteraceae bacterium]|nr:1-acyl-sn-glycerol-3-phosphate acyltransferase [Hymenobacteraceae bacterium]